MLRQIKNLLKHRMFRDLSIRSDTFGRLSMAELAVQFVHVNAIHGSYLEFGVFRGYMFSTFYHLFKRRHLQVSMYAFDSFQGLPPPQGLDATPGYDQFAAGEFSCSEQEFVNELASRGVPRSAYTIIPGLFQESLTPELYSKPDLKNRAAIIWIDCDLYESTRPALEFIFPTLQDGTVLIFDEFYSFKANPRFGEQRAFNEWLAEHPELQVTDYARFKSVGQAFILHPG